MFQKRINGIRSDSWISEDLVSIILPLLTNETVINLLPISAKTAVTVRLPLFVLN